MSGTTRTTIAWTLGLLLATGGLTAGCGGGGGTKAPFIFEVIAPTSDGPDTPVYLNAVDELQILFMPDMRRGQEFEQPSMSTFAEGEVTSRVTSIGQYQVIFSRAWVVEHAVRRGAAFSVEIPFYYEGGKQSSDIRQPTVRASVYQGGEPIAENPPVPPVPWPLPEGGSQMLPLECNTGFEMQCQNLD